MTICLSGARNPDRGDPELHAYDNRRVLESNSQSRPMSNYRRDQSRSRTSPYGVSIRGYVVTTIDFM